jgi:hypothetical protein
MSLESWSRLLAHATLALACACLIEAEAPFVPGLQACLAPVVVLVLLAFWSEGRWSLPAWGANVLGLVIAAGATAWLTLQLSNQESWVAQVPMPTAVVPHVGPVLMALVLVKLFRPRVPGDFWRLHGLGLLQVGLGCVLATGPAFGVLLPAYLACGLASLALHYRLPGSDARVAWWLGPFTLRWTLAVAVPALALFLLTPRRDEAPWEPLGRFSPERPRPTRAQAGLGPEINLNQTGAVELDDEVALQVTAEDDTGQAKRDLPADQRWRGLVLDFYESGKWTTEAQLVGMPAGVRPQRQLPDFGPGQYFLTFTVRPRQAGGLVLAEPVRFGPPPARLPVVGVAGHGRQGLFFELSGTVLPLLFTGKQEYRYRQVVPPQADPMRMPAERLDNLYVERLTRQRVPGLDEWTINLLRRLAGDPRYRLPASLRPALAGPTRSFLLEPDEWEPVARALTDYLSASGEYTYSLELSRQDLDADPVMDFLCNVKQGHCERYATALALMLRSVGIPARLVKGFKGADAQGDGTYLIRHSHAHAWVEALVPRRPPPPVPAPGGGTGGGFDWLTLDATAGRDAPAPAAFSLARWWESGQRNGLMLWRELILGYNAEEQADLWDSLDVGRYATTAVKVGLAFLGALTAAAGLLLLHRWARRRSVRRPRSRSAVAFYRRLVALLARHALRPQPAQTPREFGRAARRFLEARPGAAVLADLPERVAELFYRVRFGGRPLDGAEGRDLDAELDRLAEALR